MSVGSGLGAWAVCVTDPQLRPLRRLRVRTAELGWSLNDTGTATCEFAASCDLPVKAGWHHLAAWRCDHRWPLWAGPIRTFNADSGQVEAVDLSWWLSRRVALTAGLGQDRAADPTEWVDRILRDANRQGPLPVATARAGDTASVQAALTISRTDTLLDALGRLVPLGVSWVMQGPVLRFGVGGTAPPGPLLTTRQLRSFRVAASSEAVSQVVVVSGDLEASFPARPVVSGTAGVVVVEASDVTSLAGLARLAEIHYRQLAGPSVDVSDVAVTRGSAVGPRDLVPGRQVRVAEGRNLVLAQIAALKVTVTGGAEQSVAVDLQRGDLSSISGKG